MILPEPQPLLTRSSKVPGLDGQKMSKSYHNTIGLREDPASVEKKIKTMPTDPARVRLSDPGDPNKCPVWEFHLLYSNEDVKSWVQESCQSAAIGCLECKQKVIDEVLDEQLPIRERAQQYMEDSNAIKTIIAEGCEKARDVARETLDEVRQAMGLSYR